MQTKNKSFDSYLHMKKIHLKLIALLIFVMSISSCASKKEILYFQDVDLTIKDTISSFEPKIQKGDLVLINISATNAKAAIPFNLYDVPPGDQVSASGKPLAYLVDNEGNVNIPVLGEINIEGLSTIELKRMLINKLENYITDPVINIRLENFRVSVLGEVNIPGAYEVPNERMSIIEAISLAGDLTIYGERESILLIRTENETKQYVTLDITNKDILESPYYYLKQNDIIYVKPNKTRVNASAVGGNTSIIISSISLLLTIVAFII